MRISDKRGMARGLIIAVSEKMIKGNAMNCMNQTGLNGNPTSPGNVSGTEKCMTIHVYLPSVHGN
jgi:hypothetical protein